MMRSSITGSQSPQISILDVHVALAFFNSYKHNSARSTIIVEVITVTSDFYWPKCKRDDTVKRNTICKPKYLDEL